MERLLSEEQKFRRGVLITGLSLSASFGTLVELTYAFDERVRDVLLNRAGHLPITPEIAELQP